MIHLITHGEHGQRVAAVLAHPGEVSMEAMGALARRFLEGIAPALPAVMLEAGERPMDYLAWAVEPYRAYWQLGSDDRLEPLMRLDEPGPFVDFLCREGGFQRMPYVEFVAGRY